MDQILAAFRSNGNTLRPEIAFYYGSIAVLATIFVNWTLATLLVILRPFTCAAILLTFARPDLIQTLMDEESLKHISDKIKHLFSGILQLLLKLGQYFREN